MRLARLFAGTLVLVAAIACGDSPTSPGAGPAVQTPPGSAPAPPRQPVNGEIAIAAASPEPGASLALRPCPVTVDGTPHSETARYLCTDLRALFDVVVDADIPEALLTLTFAKDTQQCAFASSPAAALTAGSKASIGISDIRFHVGDDDPQAPQGCPTLPVATNQLEVVLWRRGVPTTVVLRREFPVTYTFAPPE